MPGRKILPCIRCQTDVEVGISVPKTYCRPCRRDAHNERMLEKYHRNKRRGPTKRKRDYSGHGLYELVATPLTYEEGAYPLGAVFSRTEVAFGLAMGAFVEGTVLHDQKKEKDWRVEIRNYIRVGDRFVLVDKQGKVYKPRNYGGSN